MISRASSRTTSAWHAPRPPRGSRSFSRSDAGGGTLPGPFSPRCRRPA
jgi:hypothetical protein